MPQQCALNCLACTVAWELLVRGAAPRARFQGRCFAQDVRLGKMSELHLALSTAYSYAVSFGWNCLRILVDAMDRFYR